MPYQRDADREDAEVIAARRREERLRHLKPLEKQILKLMSEDPRCSHPYALTDRLMVGITSNSDDRRTAIETALNDLAWLRLIVRDFSRISLTPLGRSRASRR